MLPKVSVILGVFNGEKYIEKCLESVFQQDFDSYEVIVVNDGSTDKTADILSKYRHEARIIHKAHSGISKTYNLGISSSLGRYVSFIAHDDWWKKNLVQTLYESMGSAGEALVYGDTIVVMDNNVKVLSHPDYDPYLLKKECYINASCVMMSKRFLDILRKRDGHYFDESLRSSMDWDLWIRLSQLCSFKHIPIPLCYRQYHEEQLSRKLVHIKDRWKVFKKYNRARLRDYWEEFLLPVGMFYARKVLAWLS